MLKKISNNQFTGTEEKKQKLFKVIEKYKYNIHIIINNLLNLHFSLQCNNTVYSLLFDKKIQCIKQFVIKLYYILY